MRIRNFIPPLLLTGVSAVAIAVAPLAGAAPSGPTCTSTGAVSVCQTDGNAQVTATHPPVNYQSQYPFFGPYPYGLLFHHGGHHR
jgi:hypothetical protein